MVRRSGASHREATQKADASGRSAWSTVLQLGPDLVFSLRLPGSAPLDNDRRGVPLNPIVPQRRTLIKDGTSGRGHSRVLEKTRMPGNPLRCTSPSHEAGRRRPIRAVAAVPFPHRATALMGRRSGASDPEATQKAGAPGRHVTDVPEETGSITSGLPTLPRKRRTSICVICGFSERERYCCLYSASCSFFMSFQLLLNSFCSSSVRIRKGTWTTLPLNLTLR